MSNVKTKSKIFVIALSIVLFVACCGLSLKLSGYALPFGWQVEKHSSVPAGFNIPDDYTAACDRQLTERGFPLTAMMPYDDQGGCNDQYNLTALVLDVLIAVLISVGISWLTMKVVIKKDGSKPS